MSLKVETRGKYPGVKVHLDPDDCQSLMEWFEECSTKPTLKLGLAGKIAAKMGQKIKDLLVDQPDLFKEKTPEQLAAILIKEAEKPQLQLKHLKATGSLEHLNQDSLKTALLQYVK